MVGGMCLLPANTPPQSILTVPIAHAQEVSIESDIDIHVANLADTILQLEGRCSQGSSGEVGCFQFLRSTWIKYSTSIVGEVIPQTSENERYIAEQMIKRWILQGVSDRGIFLTWNQGTPGPDCYKGVNQWGTSYDSCAYADAGVRILKQRSASDLEGSS